MQTSADSTGRDSALARLTPIAVTWQGGEAVVVWRDLGRLAFDQPFFRDSLRQAQRLTSGPQRLVRAAAPRRSGVEELASEARARPGLPLSGLVFHMTHCGSTLISQALGCLPRVLALGEPDPLADLLAPSGEVLDPRLAATLSDLVSLLGRPRREEQTHYLIKAWSPLACRLEVFRRAFPGCPWVFVYRDPLEVLVALQDTGGGLLDLCAEPARAERLLGFEPGEVAAMGRTEFAARALARICTAAAACAEAAGPSEMLAVDHRRLPEAIWESTAPHFGLALTEAERASVEARSGFDAKNPHATFADDAADKRARAGPRPPAPASGRGPARPVAGLKPRSADMPEPIYAAKIKHKLFTAEECAKLIALDYGWQDSKVSSAGDDDVVNPEGKIGRYMLLPLEDATQWIYQRLSKFLKASGGFGFVVETIGAPLKVQMYPEGGFHAWHSDIGNPRNVNRKIAISVQLSDPGDYDGGALEFFDHPQPVAAPRDQGCAVAYPAFLPHQVARVMRGTRYALTAWCLGPPFK